MSHLSDRAFDRPICEVLLNQKYFNYATGLRMVFDDKWEKLFGFKKKEEEDEEKEKGTFT